MHFHLIAPDPEVKKTGGDLLNQYLISTWKELGILVSRNDSFDDIHGDYFFIDSIYIDSIPEGYFIGKKCILILHYSTYLQTGDFHRKEQESHIYNQFQSILVFSEYMKRCCTEVFQIPEKKIFCWEPGPMLPRSSKTSIENSPITFLTVAHLVPGKNIYQVLQKLNTISDTLLTHNWQYYIAGARDHHPEEDDKIRKLLNGSKLKNKIILLGVLAQEELSKVYAESDIYVHTSEHETLGLALRDAMIAGIPVIGLGGGNAVNWIKMQSEENLCPNIESLISKMKEIILNGKMHPIFQLPLQPMNLKSWEHQGRAFLGWI